MRQKFADKGLKLVWVAEQLGVSEATLQNKLNGKTKWTKLEKEKLNELLKD